MSFLIYGAYGYTGRLIAQEAKRRGLEPILAGRNQEKLSAQAAELDLDYRLFDLDDVRLVVENIRDVDTVLHCAGPFSRTSAPMVEACLKARTHYLDITGELTVFEAVSERDEAAKRAEVMLLPGVGFDVVPTDCLAAHLKSRLPNATHLTLAVQGLGEMSRGTMKTMLNGFATGSSGAVREDGAIKEVPVAHKTRQVNFGRGPVLTATVPWGDVATAYHSTGIPNVEVYMALPKMAIRAAQASRYLGGLLALDGVQNYLKKKIDARAPGPDEAQRESGQSFLWGCATDDAGNSAAARLTAPEAYHLTVLSSLAVVEKVLKGRVAHGFQTPSRAYGAGLVLELPGVSEFEKVEANCHDSAP